ncbi:MAG: transcriptional regulator [Oscillospiraceae bacterium]|nr:transcriptional regulator [Oscillospiraceae bacterium]
MKYYEQMVSMGCFSRQDIAVLSGSDAAAGSLLQSYLSKGYIERVRHNCYAVISLETKQPVLSRYQIGAKLFPDACISHHSAFELYGYANQVFYETYVSTNSRFADFAYNGVFYHRVAPKRKIWPVQVGGASATGLERTVIDSINDFEKIAGLEETLRCLMLIPSLQSDELLNVLSLYDNGYLYQKCGYILESLNDSLHLPDQFFNVCMEKRSDSKRYLTKGRDHLVWNPKWRLYVPESIQAITDKGVTDYDAI